MCYCVLLCVCVCELLNVVVYPHKLFHFYFKHFDAVVTDKSYDKSNACVFLRL